MPADALDSAPSQIAREPIERRGLPYRRTVYINTKASVTSVHTYISVLVVLVRSSDRGDRGALCDARSEQSSPKTAPARNFYLDYLSLPPLDNFPI